MFSFLLIGQVVQSVGHEPSVFFINWATCLKRLRTPGLKRAVTISGAPASRLLATVKRTVNLPSLVQTAA